MIKFKFVILLVILSSALIAQKVDVVWGEEIKIEKKERYIEIIGDDGEFFYTAKDLFGTNKEFVLEKYGVASVNRKFSKKISLPQINGQNMGYEQIVMINGQIYLFTTVDNKETGSYQAYCTTLSSDGEWMDIPRLVCDLGIKNKHGSGYELEIASDSSKFLLYHDAPFERRMNEAFQFNVIDLELNTVWSKTLELPYSHDLFELNEFRLDQDGNLYILSGIGQEKVKDDRTWRSARKKEYLLISYDWQKNKVTEFDVELNDKWIISVTCGIAPSGDLAIGGFYSNDQYFSIAGTFYFRLDAETKSVKAKGLKAFDRHFLGQFMNEKRVERGHELSNFYFDYLVLRDDGSALMVAEQFYVSEHIAPDPTTNHSVITYFYNYNDVIAIDIDPTGAINWTKRIAKEQSTSNDQGSYSSYSLIETDDGVLFFYNDHPDNTNLLRDDPQADPHRFSNIKKSVAVMTKLSRNGDQMRQSLFANKDAETILRPKLAHRTGSSMIIYGQYKRTYRFGRLDI